MAGTGERIKSVRGTLSRDKFSALTGISKTALVNYETEERTPSADYLAKILELFPDISPEWLLMGEGGMKRGKNAIPKITATGRLLNNAPKTSATGRMAKYNDDQTERYIRLLEVQNERDLVAGRLVWFINELNDDNVLKLAEIAQKILNLQEQEEQNDNSESNIKDTTESKTGVNE